MSECPKCHTQVLPNSRYCDMCGYELVEAEVLTQPNFSSDTQSNPTESKSPLAAEVLDMQTSEAEEENGQKETEKQSAPVTGGSKAALPSTPSQILRTTKLRSQNTQIKSSLHTEGFLIGLADRIRSAAAEVSSATKTFISKNSKTSSAGNHSPQSPASASTEESTGQTIANKIIAALLGIGVLVLCIFMIAKKLALSALSPFNKNI
ncbi:MAG: zinc-ribbon domain-containing protein [Candidatus Bruticola sp.]